EGIAQDGRAIADGIRIAGGGPMDSIRREAKAYSPGAVPSSLFHLALHAKHLESPRRVLFLEVEPHCTGVADGIGLVEHHDVGAGNDIERGLLPVNSILA